MSKIEFEFEISQGYYTKEELNTYIKNNILNLSILHFMDILVLKVIYNSTKKYN